MASSRSPRRTVPPEFDELNAYRLARDWSWQRLAAAMEDRTGLKIAPTTLRNNLILVPGLEGPRDRTLHKIRAFLKHVHLNERKRKSARRREAAERAARMTETTGDEAQV